MTQPSRSTSRLSWSLLDLIFLVTCVAVYFGFRQAVFNGPPSYESRFMAWIIGPPVLAFVFAVLPTAKAVRERKTKLEIIGVSILWATVAGLVSGVALQFEAFFVQNQNWGWSSFEREYEKLLTVHHIVLSSAGAGALSGLALGGIASAYARVTRVSHAK